MTNLAERLERLERLMGVGAGAAGDGGFPGQTGGAPADAATAPAQLSAAWKGHAFTGWMKAHFDPGHVLVAIGVKTDQGGWNSFVQRGAGKPLRRSQLASAAALCQALSSEARLAILNELVLGDRTTAELMESAGLDRGQLYHHLRDLFVQGLVEQPERGRYAATPRGRSTFFAACVLPNAGDATDKARALDLSDPDAAEPPGNR
ncbi:MAG TPA: winged helix-turn-helix domain-containing protein [Chloroflexota bacterium]|nr:winged helix-turn-helix domain-containing protein [Chloroflexota bacterium]